MISSKSYFQITKNYFQIFALPKSLENYFKIWGISPYIKWNLTDKKLFYTRNDILLIE